MTAIEHGGRLRPTSASSDAALLAGCAIGDERALIELYDRHADLVYARALQLVGDPSNAEAVTGDVFVEAWRAAATRDAGRRPVAGWLLTLTHRRATATNRAPRS